MGEPKWTDAQRKVRAGILRFVISNGGRAEWITLHEAAFNYMTVSSLVRWGQLERKGYAFLITDKGREALAEWEG